MGVIVGYKGAGGARNFNLEGLPTGEAERVLGSRKKKHVPENFLQARNPQPIDPLAEKEKGLVKLNDYDNRPAPLDKKLMLGGAVVASSSGLCLEGEQQSSVVIGDKMYGSLAGRKGYFSMDEIDPPQPSAERVGPLGAGGEEADDSVGKVGSSFAYQVASRLNLEKDASGNLILVEYDKDVKTTDLGRTSEVTGEVRRVVGVLPFPDVRPPHPYEVRWATPVTVTKTDETVPTLGATHWKDPEGENEGEDENGEGEDEGISEYPSTKTKKKITVTPEGEGFWMIWLPSNKLLNVYGQDLDVREYLDPADSIGEGWYKLVDIFGENGGNLYLNINNDDSGYTAEFSANNSGDISILVTTVKVNGGVRSITPSVMSAIRHGGGESGGGGEISGNVLVGMSLDYVSDESDKDFSAHPYCIRLKRGRVKVENGSLTIEEDESETQFIATTPHSGEYS